MIIAIRKIIILFVFFVSSAIFSQTEYFSTDGINRLTKSEKNKMLNDLSVKFSKTLNKEMFATAVIKETFKKDDSIIHQITISISDKSENELSEKAFSQLENKKFPNFELQSLDNGTFTLDDIKGKPTLINFWFTQCAPCIDEMPILNEIYDNYKDKVNFIAITYESKENVLSFLKEHPYKFKHLINSDKFIKELEISSFPLNIFINKDGIVKKIERGIPYKKYENGKLIMENGNEFEKIIKEMI